MMMLILIALAPVLMIALYIYARDKYEKEPVRLLLKSLLLGAIITWIAIITGLLLDALKPSEPMLLRLFFEAFIVAALNEEMLKFIAFMLFIWNDRNFNENFDGIVYAVFISLGFAGIENILYVIQGGISTGILRAFTSVPGHALDGVFMGYFLARAKFNPEIKNQNLFLAFMVPFLLHGVWDFLIFLIRDSQGIGLSVGIFLLLFILFVVALYLFGIRQINRSVASSQFRKSD